MKYDMIIYKQNDCKQLLQYKQYILHCKSKIVKITNSFVSTVARNNGNCVGSYDCMVTYNVHVLIILPIIIQ